VDHNYAALARHEGMYNFGYVEDFFDMLEETHVAVGMPWRTSIGHYRGDTMQSLRSVIHLTLNVQYWHEVSVGHSWEQYKSLDFYVHTRVLGVLPEELEAWSMLMTHETPMERRIIPASHWYHMPFMICWGQRAGPAGRGYLYNGGMVPRDNNSRL